MFIVHNLGLIKYKITVGKRSILEKLENKNTDHGKPLLKTRVLTNMLGKCNNLQVSRLREQEHAVCRRCYQAHYILASS